MSHANSSRSRRVLLLVHPTLIPDAKASALFAATQQWRTEHEVLVALHALGHEVLPVGLSDSLEPLEMAILEFRPDIVFNLTEDFDGDARKDANIVSYLEMRGVPYTGCNARGLILAREKPLAKKIWRYHALPTPDFTVVPRGRNRSRAVLPPFPLIVKSTCEEASAGISGASIVDNNAALKARIDFVHATVGTDALVESFVEGRELYVGVLGAKRLRALPVWELFLDSEKKIATQRVKWSPTYRRKHRVSSGRAKLDPKTETRIQSICMEAYRALDLSGYVRFDLRLDRNGIPLLLEANPNPHLGKSEDFAKAAKFDGASYAQLIHEILRISSSLRRSR